MYNYVKTKSIRLCLILICFLAVFSACRKDRPDEDIVTSRKKEILNNLDSIYFYAQQIYLWNDELPPFKTFKPERFYNLEVKEIELYKREIFAFSQFALNKKNRRPYELNPLYPLLPKYSTIIDPLARDEGNEAYVTDRYLAGNGFGISWVSTQDTVRVLYTELNSPARRSGIHRGDKIVAINDESLKNPQSFTIKWIEATKKNYIKIGIIDARNKARQVRLSTSYYEQNPLLKHAIIKSGSRKIGYIAYNSFTEVENTKKYLDPVFDNFIQEGICDLVVDLRYNGGGYQSSAEYLANCIAPQTASGSVMFTEHYNEMMQKGKADILRNQLLLGYDQRPIYVNGKAVTLYDIDFSVRANTVKFRKTNHLEDLKTVYFIVSENTASASELLINVLKPYRNLKLVGVSNTGAELVRTYGKPIGFFDISVDSFKLYLAMYQNRNAADDGDYYDGLLADYSTKDNPSFDFGSIEDPAIKLIINSHLVSSSVIQKVPPRKASRDYIEYFFDSGRLQGTIKSIKNIRLKSSL